MKSEFLNQWQQLQQVGVFKWFGAAFSSWKELIENIISFTETQDNTNFLLCALFQISGVAIPLKFNYNPQNKIQAEWFHQIGNGNCVAAHCMTEPTGGTDVFSMQTKANRVDEGWLLNGTKTYICNAPVADVGLLYASIEGLENAKPYNLGCFLLDMSKPGVTIDPPLEKIGLVDIPMSTIHLKNVLLPSEYVIGDIGSAQHIVNMSTTFERLLIPIAFVGIMQKLFTHAKGALKSEIYRHLCVCKSFLMTTLSNIDLATWDRSYIPLGCLLKWHLSETYINVAKMSNDERIYRDALSSWIYSGTNDVLKHTLERLL